jgi:electron transfer flavoprotein alpha subunit
MSVIVYTENWDGKFKKLSFELASYASKLASVLNTDAIAISIGKVNDDELLKLGQHGIKKIIAVEAQAIEQFDSRVYARVIAETAKSEGATVVLLANNNSGKSLAPRISVRMKAAIGSGVNQLPVSTSPFLISRKVFSGNAFAHVEMHTDVKILTLAQNSFDIVEQPVDATVVRLDAGSMVDSSAVKVLDVQKQTGKILLSDAEVVVSGGRGMKSPDNWAPLLELADLLGAATACSRPVSDEGWRPHEEHTGQTGKIIAPNVYFAVGISGATQHLAGISSSKYIVAINSDKDAPIFDAAQYGIVGDASRILPKLVEAVRTIKSS